MNIAGTTYQAWTPYKTNLDGTPKQRLEHFQAFRTALQAGNLSGAKDSFAAFQKDMRSGLQNLAGGGAATQHAQATGDLKTLGDALDSGDMSGAQQAFVALKRDVQSVFATHVHMNHGGAGGGTRPADAGMAGTFAGPEPRGEVLNTYA